MQGTCLQKAGSSLGARIASTGAYAPLLSARAHKRTNTATPTASTCTHKNMLFNARIMLYFYPQPWNMRYKASILNRRHGEIQDFDAEKMYFLLSK